MILKKQKNLHRVTFVFKLIIFLFVFVHSQKCFNQFWHLRDPTIGMQFVQKLDQPLSWNFSLWDLASKNGVFCKVAIIDTSDGEKLFSQKTFCNICARMLASKQVLPAKLVVGEVKKNSLCLQCKHEVFLCFSKNIDFYHGMYTTNLIHQIAPDSKVVTYDIFKTYGHASSKDLFSVLDTIAQGNFDIVHLGCKITTEPLSLKDQEKLEDKLSKMNFVVAASGNDSSNKQEAYPARCCNVDFDVGAFYRNHLDRYTICPFSQFEIGMGPKIVAPGYNISCSISYEDEHLGYCPVSGTSFAAALVSGLLALVISEFKLIFSRKQILTVLYQCTQKLSDQKDWQEKVVLGALDIRSSLFCLHVLNEIKNILPIKNFNKYYDTLVKEICIINTIHVFSNNTFVQEFLRIYGKQGSLQKRAALVAKLTLKAYHSSIKYAQRKELFDKKLIYLLRTIKENTFQLQTSKLEHDRIQYSLNRKKRERN